MDIYDSVLIYFLFFQEADIALGPITITDRRLKVIDFTVPFMSFKSMALIKPPEHCIHRSTCHIHTIEELVDSSYQYGTLDNSPTKEFMETSGQSTNRTFNKMWAEMCTFWPSAFMTDLNEGLYQASKRPYAFILDAPKAEYLATREPCDKYTLGPFLELQQYGIVVAKNSHLRAKINSELQKMEQKELNTFYMKWWKEQCRLSVPTNLNTESLTTEAIRSRTTDSNNRRKHPRNKGHSDRYRNGRKRNKNGERSPPSTTAPPTRLAVYSSASHTTSVPSPWRSATAVGYASANFSVTHVCNHVISVMMAILASVVSQIFV